MRNVYDIKAFPLLTIWAVWAIQFVHPRFKWINDYVQERECALTSDKPTQYTFICLIENVHTEEIQRLKL